jgi:hypothetical protein
MFSPFDFTRLFDSDRITKFSTQVRLSVHNVGLPLNVAGNSASAHVNNSLGT